MFLLLRAPTDCKQYFTGRSGNFKSYNFGGGVMLASQIYTMCFRQELGKQLPQLKPIYPHLMVANWRKNFSGGVKSEYFLGQHFS